ncbi:MAG: response regulator transcription factor [Saprospiraceae bacterium]|nr:response regulator transcription factor [Saprospiraceae bacterium]MBK6566276.1 response regulator transcription factor [Saprospiraceae bacterium]MBK7524201.1 response regulator transcription factor [Saprospiraceae bacterium]MBK8372879.1 response regulator transcription factor [Saprospiraceae bacterium]MBK8548989.1 response regulator transcription factor [Saprospiraceae bacterium]
MKAIIIEDEEIIAKVLLNKIKKVAPDIDVVTILPSLKTARKWFGENAEPDLLFMDIQLSDGVSFDIFNDFNLKCPVIFTTAYDEFAIRAFKVNGVDYLLKPVIDQDLAEAINKCRKLLEKNELPFRDMTSLIQSLTNPDSAARYKEKFIVNVRNQWMPVNAKDIACFCKEIVNYIYLLNGERYAVDFVTLEEIEDVLDPKQFYRANRQYIINVDAIHTVKPVENSKLIIKLKEPNHKLEIDMSRVKSPEFKKWLDR